MFQTKVVENIKTHILCSVTIFENRAVYEIKCKNTVEPGKPQMTVWRMRIICWIPEATNTHSKYVMLLLHCNNSCINAFQCYHIRTLPVL